MRMDYFAANPDALQPLIAIETYLARAARRRDELGGGLLELVKTRVSQINGCAYCIDRHTQDARRAGESEQRLYALSAWRETPFFTPRERAALTWAEAHTLIAGRGIDDALFDANDQYARRGCHQRQSVSLCHRSQHRWSSRDFTWCRQGRIMSRIASWQIRVPFERMLA